MIVPHFSTFGESLSASTEVFGELRKIIAKKYGKESTVMGDEGGFAPNISDVEEPLRLIQTAVDRLGYEKEFKFAIDVAASEFYRRPIPGFEGHYLVNGKQLAHHKMIEIYENLISNYPIISIEDPFNQENFEEFAQFTKEFGKKVQVVGDDLLVTNLERLKHAVALKAGNALLLKVNQIGTLTEALEAARYALENKWHVMVSHRSGETMDTFISDLTVGIGCGQIKAGAPSKPERLAKYKRLIEIERELGNRAKYGRQ
jgi:enolase